MPCNAHNHPPDCDCGWGGQGYSGAGSGGGSFRRSFQDQQLYTPKLKDSFLSPNANCPVCGARVYFYANSFGSRVFFDDVGPPWPKHPCTDRARVTQEYLINVHLDEIRSRYEKRPAPARSMDRGEWKAFKVLRTRSFRQEIEHLATGKKFETNLLKEKLPRLPETIWIREAGPTIAEISYFDDVKFEVVFHDLPAFDARKYATLAEWSPFKMWFQSL